MKLKLLFAAGLSVMVVCYSSAQSSSKTTTETKDEKNKQEAVTVVKTISRADSILLKKYLHKRNVVRLYSTEYQRYMDSALAIVPWKADYWQQKAMPMFKQHKYEAGMVFLDSAVKYDRNNHWLEYRAFIKCIFQKSYAEAIIDFEKAKKIKGFAFVMDHSYDFYMGLCYLQTNKFEKADSLIQSSIVWDETNFKQGHYLEYFYLGICKMEKGQDNDAIVLFDKSLSLYPEYPDAKFYKAICLNNRGESEKAIEVLAEGERNVNQGYGMNEDNTYYEDYPYQKKKRDYEFMAGYLKSSN